MSVYDFLVDFAIASALILVGQFLRAKIKFFQEFFIPASGNRIRQLKSRPIYWLPIKGGMKCEE